jgi:hypothetical protein
MTRNSISLLLVLALSLSGAAAACGGTPTPDGQVPGNPSSSTATFTPSATPTDSSTAAPSSTATTPTASATTSATTTPPAAIQMKNASPSAMLADIQKIGLDAKSLPPMAKMVKTEKKKLRQVMDLFVKATGLKCKECHDADDYAKDTAMKNVATHMWDEFVVKLTMADGSPVFCDSCHTGTTKLLDRSNKKALAKWMQTAFVDTMARRDKKDHACSTCHGTDMNMDIISDWKKK